MKRALFIKGLSYSYLRQITTLITGIISLPLLLNYFGNTNYGIWTLVLGLTGYINTISFGIPSAMITLVAKSSSLNEKYKILKKSFYILFVLSASFLALFIFALYFNDNWIISLLGNIDIELVAMTKKIFILFVIFTLIKLPLNLYMQFFTGMNTIYISEIYQILTSLINFASVLIAIFFNIEIFSFVILWLAGQLVLNIIAVLHVLVKFAYLKKESDGVSNISNSVILKSGFAFFQVGIAATIVWSTDNLIISHFMSPEFVTSYTIAFKIFTYIFMLSAIINSVIGPMYGNAYVKNDWESIKKYTSLIHKLLPILGALVWMFLIFFAKEIIILWTGNKDAFGGYLLIFSLGLYGYILSFVMNFATLAFSLNYAKDSLKIAWGEALLNLILSIILIQYFGIGGVAFATAMASFIACFLFFPRLIKRLTNGEVVYDFTYVKKHFIFLVIPFILLSIFIIDLNIIFKIIIFTFVLFIYTLVSWRLLSSEDKVVLFSVLKRKG